MSFLIITLTGFHTACLAAWVLLNRVCYSALACFKIAILLIIVFVTVLFINVFLLLLMYSLTFTAHEGG